MTQPNILAQGDNYTYRTPKQWPCLKLNFIDIQIIIYVADSFIKSVFYKVSKMKLYLPNQKGSTKEALIILKIVSLAFNRVITKSITLVETPLT